MYIYDYNIPSTNDHGYTIDQHGESCINMHEQYSTMVNHHPSMVYFWQQAFDLCLPNQQFSEEKQVGENFPNIQISIDLCLPILGVLGSQSFSVPKRFSIQRGMASWCMLARATSATGQSEKATDLRVKQFVLGAIIIMISTIRKPQENGVSMGFYES